MAALLMSIFCADFTNAILGEYFSIGVEILQWKSNSFPWKVGFKLHIICRSNLLRDLFIFHTFCQTFLLSNFPHSLFCLRILLTSVDQCYKDFFWKIWNSPKVRNQKSLLWYLKLHKMWKQSICMQEYALKLLIAF